MQDFAASGADCTSWPQTRTVPEVGARKAGGIFIVVDLPAPSGPRQRTVPEVGARKPVIIFIVVDLPAPFGPRKPSTSPARTSKETSSTAVRTPKRRVRWLISSIRYALSLAANVT